MKGMCIKQSFRKITKKKERGQRQRMSPQAIPAKILIIKYAKYF